jgi:hypothetical protein
MPVAFLAGKHIAQIISGRFDEENKESPEVKRVLIKSTIQVALGSNVITPLPSPFSGQMLQLMEFLGAITVGYGVSDTIQKGVSDITDPKGQESNGTMA